MTPEVLTSADIPRKLHYAIFGYRDDTTGFDIYLIRGDDPKSWVFINERKTVEEARACVREYLRIREIARQIGPIR